MSQVLGVTLPLPVLLALAVTLVLGGIVTGIAFSLHKPFQVTPPAPRPGDSADHGRD